MSPPCDRSLLPTANIASLSKQLPLIDPPLPVSKPSPAPTPLNEVTAKLLKNIEFRDKVLKLVGYVNRLVHYNEVAVKLNGGDVSVQGRLMQLDGSIVSARQMCNMFKYLDSVLIFFKVLRQKGMQPWEKAASLTRIFFWTMEVVASDLTVAAKYFFHSWDSARIGSYYKMGKSIALTILATLEAIAIKRIYSAAAKRTDKQLSDTESKEVNSRVLQIIRCFCDCVC